ncbi:cobra-like protein 2 [Quercus suber]|uniref:Cobra-like protein 2 n=1 Tax=Quercus suber TaxID=58331 RepID=A0AAW0LWR3_QUESU
MASLQKMLWERVEIQNQAGGPGARVGHTCNVVGNLNFLYVFGGYDANRNFTNSVLIFDTSRQDEYPSQLELPSTNSEAEPQPLVSYSSHMCPIQVHWHVKQNYREYWRVKITVTNLNYAKNYSQWNLAMLHPNFRNINQVFSFNYKPLNQYGIINDTGVFYGIQYYNEMLLQAGPNENVQIEMLLQKDPDMFTFRKGWGFPRKVSFNGDECVMPSPDRYPRLPNSAHNVSKRPEFLIFFSFLLFIIVL